MDTQRYETIVKCLKDVLRNRTDKNIKVFLDNQSIDPAILSAMGRAYDQGFADAVKKQLDFPDQREGNEKGCGSMVETIANNSNEL